MDEPLLRSTVEPEPPQTGVVGLLLVEVGRPLEVVVVGVAALPL